MPELTSIQLGDGTLAFAHYMNSTELIMRSSCALTMLVVDLPKLTTLVSLDSSYGGNRPSFSSPRIVTLESHC